MYYIRGESDAWLRKRLRYDLVEELIQGHGQFLFIFDKQKNLITIVDLESDKFHGGGDCITYNDWARKIEQNLDRYSLPTE
jgi:hypothetical protein